MKTLSVVIPVYKIKEKYLRECLNSISFQHSNEIEIILVDDGSPDNCGKICDEYAATDNRFKVIHQENQGVSVARNMGIKESNGEWITFIDPDDWIEADWGEVILNAVKAVGTDIIMFDYYQEFATKHVPQFFMHESALLNEEYLKAVRIAPFNQLFIHREYKNYEINPVWNKVYRTSFLKKHNIMFDPKARKGQDNIFNAEIFQLTSKIYYLHAPLYHYRYIQESVTNRYNPNIRYYNEIAFQHYERIIKTYSLPIEYTKAFYAKVLTRLYSCMRLYYFHIQNNMSFNNIRDGLNNVLDTYPYNVALCNIDQSYLSFSQKIFVYMLKKRNYRLLKFLVNGHLWLKKTILKNKLQ